MDGDLVVHRVGARMDTEGRCGALGVGVDGGVEIVPGVNGLAVARPFRLVRGTLRFRCTGDEHDGHDDNQHEVSHQLSTILGRVQPPRGTGLVPTGLIPPA